MNDIMKIRLFTIASAAVAMSACAGADNRCEMGTYGYDRAFFAKHGIGTVELQSPDGNAKIMVIPA